MYAFGCVFYYPSMRKLSHATSTLSTPGAIKSHHVMAPDARNIPPKNNKRMCAKARPTKPSHMFSHRYPDMGAKWRVVGL